MKYFYYFINGIIALLALYVLFGIGNFHLAYHNIKTPSASFQILEGDNKALKLVDFTNYQCSGCKQLHPVIKELRELRPDLTYIVRPIALPRADDTPKQAPASLERLALAAGLQGKFEEFHAVFMEYPTFPIPEDVIIETANLYGLDYAKLTTDAQGDAVTKILSNNINDMKALSIRTIPSYILYKNIYSVSNEDLPDLKDMLEIIPLK